MSRTGTDGDQLTDGGASGPLPCAAAAAEVAPSSGLSRHFRTWLESQPSFVRDFSRDDVVGGSFGGLSSEDDCVAKQPVILIHGNSDRAFGGPMGGWQTVRSHFFESGYRSAELYATTYGSANVADALETTHSRDNVMQVRRFIEAVLSYTGAEEVDLIAHSLGVTLARRAILGGTAVDVDGTSYEVGPPLGARIDTFVAIAGANLGLQDCLDSPFPACSHTVGLYPGELEDGEVKNRSKLLDELNASPGYEASFRHSIWTDTDDVIKYGCQVHGQNTCQVPGETSTHSLSDLTHLQARDETAALQLQLVAPQ